MAVFMPLGGPIKIDLAKHWLSQSLCDEFEEFKSILFSSFNKQFIKTKFFILD